MPFKPTPIPGTLHHYSPRLVAFEHPPSSPTGKDQPKNYVLFLGGLGDGLRTVAYPLAISKQLPPSYSVVEVLLSSSYSGWTNSNLDEDADEAAACVAYFRSLQSTASAPSKIILMGHSTGCQITAHYLVGPWQHPTIPSTTLSRPAIDGIVLQAGVSDREGLVEDPKMPRGPDASLALAREMVASGRGHDHLPHSATNGDFGANPSAARWVSLASGEPDEAADDYFSSDIDGARLERVWGASGIAGRKVPVLVMLSGNDAHMPSYVDKGALVARWGDAVKAAGGAWDDGSGVVLGASHNLNGSPEEAVLDLSQRVVAFAERVGAVVNKERRG